MVACLHACLRACGSVHACIRASVHPRIRASVPAYVRTYVRTHVRSSHNVHNLHVLHELHDIVHDIPGLHYLLVMCCICLHPSVPTQFCSMALHSTPVGVLVHANLLTITGHKLRHALPQIAHPLAGPPGDAARGGRSQPGPREMRFCALAPACVRDLRALLFLLLPLSHVLSVREGALSVLMCTFINAVVLLLRAYMFVCCLHPQPGPASDARPAKVL